MITATSWRSKKEIKKQMSFGEVVDKIKKPRPKSSIQPRNIYSAHELTIEPKKAP